MKLDYRCALITGASSGIGEGFALALARTGTDLILVARSGDRLETLAQTLRRDHAVEVTVIALDLAQPRPGERLAAAVAEHGREVDLLINNAGFGAVSAFHEQPAERDQQMIALNIGAVVDLTHAFLPAMLAAGRGAVINIASMAAFQPTPYLSVYGATKSFVLSFTEALWAEYRSRGLRFLAVCPGPVDTPFFEATGNPKLRGTVPSPLMLSVETVVQDSLAALQANRLIAVPGVPNRLLAQLPRLLPRRLMAASAALFLKR